LGSSKGRKEGAKLSPLREMGSSGAEGERDEVRKPKAREGPRKPSSLTGRKLWRTFRWLVNREG